MGLGAGLPLLSVWAVLLPSFLLFFCLFVRAVLLPSFLLFFCSCFFWAFLGPSLGLFPAYCLVLVAVAVEVDLGFAPAAGFHVGIFLGVH